MKMNKVQFMDSLRHKLDDLPTSERDRILFAYSDYLAQQTASGVSEAEAVRRLGPPDACAAKARIGQLPGTEPSARGGRSGNPFEPQMAARPRRTALSAPKKAAHPEEPAGKRPWGILILVTLAAILALGFAAVRYFSSSERLGYAEREQQFALSEIRSIVVEDQDRAIEVLPLTTSDVRVHYYEGHHQSYSLTLEDGVLTVRSQDDRRWYDTLLSLYDSTIPVLRLYLPPDYAGSLELRTSNDRIEASGLTSAQSLLLVTSNGAITLQDVAATGEILAESSNASLSFERIQTGQTLVMRTSNGGLSLSGAACQTLYMQTTNGLIEFDSLDSAIESLTFETSNASIQGTLYGCEEDFTIHAATTNSRNNLTDRSGGSRDLRAETSNGTIDIQICPET